MDEAISSENLPPPLRSWRERVLQTLAFEASGLIVVSPLMALVTGAGTVESIGVLAALSVAVMSWTGLFNTVFDMAEAKFAGRKASDRPQRWRIVHAATLEVTSVIATTPLIVFMTGLGWLEALLLDVGLGFAYVAYAYLFYMAFDWVRPVADRVDEATVVARRGDGRRGQETGSGMGTRRGRGTGRGRSDAG